MGEAVAGGQKTVEASIRADGVVTAGNVVASFTIKVALTSWDIISYYTFSHFV